MKKRNGKLTLKRETILKLSNFKSKGGKPINDYHVSELETNSAVICCA